MSAVNNGFEIIRRFLPLVFGSVTVGAALLRIIQRTLAHRPGYQVLEGGSPPLLLQQRISSDRTSISFRLLCIRAASNMSVYLGIEQRQIGPNEEQADQNNLSALHEALSREIAPGKQADWLTIFAVKNDLGEKLEFFSEGSGSTQKLQVVRLIFRLNDIRQDKVRTLSIYPHFNRVVQVIVRSQMKNLCENQVICIEGIWVLLDVFDKKQQSHLNEMLFETHPILLDILAQVMAPQGNLLTQLDAQVIAKGLEDIYHILMINPDFHQALCATMACDSNANPDLKKMVEHTTVANMNAHFSGAAETYKEQNFLAKIQARLANEPKETIERHNRVYKESWSIYSVEIYLRAVEEVSNPPSSKRLDIEDPIASSCFKQYIQSSLNQGVPLLDGETLNLITVELSNLLDPIKPTSGSATSLEDKYQTARRLQKIKILSIEVGKLHQGGVPIDFVRSTIHGYCGNNIQCLTNENTMNAVINIVRAMRPAAGYQPLPVVAQPPIAPGVTPVQSQQVVEIAKKPSTVSSSSTLQGQEVLAKLKADPFLSISELVLPFIKSLLPKEHQSVVVKFEQHKDILRKLFDKSALKGEILNTLSEPWVASFFKVREFYGPFCKFLTSFNQETCILFDNVADGKNPLGETLTERPVKALIETIQSARKLRRSLIADNKLYQGKQLKVYLEVTEKAMPIVVWLIHDLPEECS